MSRSLSAIKNGFKKVTHVIFDLDGLLLDSEIIYTQAIQNIVKKYGKEYTIDVNRQILGSQAYELAKLVISLLNLPLSPEEFLDAKLIEQEKYDKIYTTDILKKLLGTTQRDTCIIAVREMKLPIKPEKFNEFFEKETRLRLADVGFMSGAERFVRHLHKHNIPMAVATSSSKESYELKISKHNEFFSVFHHKVTGGSDPEVKKGKPHPDIFLICAQRFLDKPHPSNCLVFEDAPNGVNAAISAGMQCVMIPDHNIVSPEHQKQATLVLKSMDEFQPEIFGLPPY